MDEDALLEKLRVAEARFAPAGQTPSVESCRAQLAQWRTHEADVECQCSVSGAGEVVLGALCVRYGIEPYRRSRRSRAVYLRVPRAFLQEVLWPQFEALIEIVEQDLARATRQVMESWAGASLATVEDDEAAR